MGLNASPPKCVEIPDVRSCCRTFDGAFLSFPSESAGETGNRRNCEEKYALGE